MAKYCVWLKEECIGTIKGLREEFQEVIVVKVCGTH